MVNEEVVYLNLRSLGKVIKRRLNIVFILTGIALILAIFYNHYMVKDVYKASSSIVVGIVADEKANQIDYNSILVTQNLLKTYNSIAKTINIAEKTVNKLRLDMSPEELQSRISSEPRPNTQILDLSVTANDPQQAYDIIKAFTDEFIVQLKSINPYGNFQYLDKIERPYSVGPSKITNILVSFCLGIVVSMIIICLIEFADNSIKTEEDIKKYVGIPLIGSIPSVKRTGKTIDLFKLIKFKGRVVETVKILRTNLEFVLKNKNIKTITVTGSMPYEGRTTAAVVLAASIAETGKKIVLVDCDFRQPCVHKIFKLSNIEGVSNILNNGTSNIDSTIQKSSIKNLDIIAAGSELTNPAELISSYNMIEFINKLKKIYDYVIMDTPPVMFFTDALVTSQITDGTLMVISCKKTDRKVAEKAKELLKNVNGKLFGVVMNKDKYLVNINYEKYYKLYNRSNKKKGKFYVDGQKTRRLPDNI